MCGFLLLIGMIDFCLGADYATAKDSSADNS
jgi:hypothetical protein